MNRDQAWAFLLGVAVAYLWLRRRPSTSTRGYRLPPMGSTGGCGCADAGSPSQGAS